MTASTLFGLEVADQLAAVLGGADGVGVALEDGLGVAVEGRQVDHADLERLAVLGLGLDDLALGVLLEQLDLLAGQLVDLPLLGAGRLDDQPDLGAARAADVADDVAELLLDEVDLLAVLLLDADDLVLGLEPAVLVGGHAGDDLLDDRVAVLRLERGADPFEREVELLADRVLERPGAHVARVRVEGPGQAAEVDLEQLGHVELVDTSGSGRGSGS